MGRPSPPLLRCRRRRCLVLAPTLKARNPKPSITLSTLPPLRRVQLKHGITALACKGDLTFAALRSGAIVECKRVHQTGEYRGHAGDVLQLLVLGDRLLSLGTDGCLLVWRIGEHGGPEAAIQLPRCGALPAVGSVAECRWLAWWSCGQE